MDAQKQYGTAQYDTIRCNPRIFWDGKYGSFITKLLLNCDGETVVVAQIVRDVVASS